MFDVRQVTKRNKFRGFSMHLVRKFAHSILHCLEALDRNGLIHCDLKPENILLKQVDPPHCSTVVVNGLQKSSFFLVSSGVDLEGTGGSSPPPKKK